VIVLKAQYVGDIGDFGKVLLLKYIAACGFRIGTKLTNASTEQHRPLHPPRQRLHGATIFSAKSGATL
jgi:hypothetical protein